MKKKKSSKGSRAVRLRVKAKSPRGIKAVQDSLDAITRDVAAIMRQRDAQSWALREILDELDKVSKRVAQLHTALRSNRVVYR